MKECNYIAKNGTNNFLGYKYATSADVLEKVNAALTKHGIASVATPNLLQFQDVTTAKVTLNTSLRLKLPLILSIVKAGKNLR